MHKQRLSQRKSVLGRGMEDYCLMMPQNSDPVISSLLSILEWQASLNVENDSVLHKIIMKQLQQLKCRLKLEHKLMRNQGQKAAEQHRANLLKYMNEYFKLKQLFSYCFSLEKKKSEINEDVEKFKFYQKKDINLSEQLESYFNEPIIFQTIYSSYLRIYSPNILTADLIKNLAEKHQERCHTQTIRNRVEAWHNSDFESLSNRSTIFKNLIINNRKYTEILQKLKNSYINFVCAKKEGEQDEEMNKNGNQSIGMNQINHKFKKLEGILKKLKGRQVISQNKNQKKQENNDLQIQLWPQPQENMELFSIYHSNIGGNVQANAKSMIISLLYNTEDSNRSNQGIDFAFMKIKIIRVEVVCYFNKILAAANTILHSFNQMDLETKTNYCFDFKDLRKLIACQFLSEDLYSIKNGKFQQPGSFFSSNPHLNIIQILSNNKEKILYPSAIYFIYGFIKVLLHIDLKEYSDLLTILKTKAAQMESLSETFASLYEIVKRNQLECFYHLRQYISILIKNSGKLQTKSIKNSESFIEAVGYGCQKAKIICQIVYELDHNYRISEALEEMIKIEFGCLTGSYSNTFVLYESILHEIIRIHNGLNLDHHFSLTQIQQNFSLFPTDGIELDTASTEKHHLFFEDIIHQICQASKVSIFLPNLLSFFELQLRLIRAVFCLQLSWSSNRQSIYERRVSVFKELVSTYTQPIMTIINNSTSILTIISKYDDIQRQISLLQKEVTHSSLVQKFLFLTKPSQNQGLRLSRQHLNRMSIDTLQDINKGMNIFNPIESFTKLPQESLINALCKNISEFSTIRIDQLKQQNPIQMKKTEKISTIIYLINSLSSRNSQQDYSMILCFYHNIRKTSYDLFQSKYKQIIQIAYSEVLNSPNITTLTQYYEALIVLAIVKTLNSQQNNLSGKNQRNSLKNLLKLFQFSEIFTNMDRIKDVEFWRKEYGIMTKFHYIYQIINSFTLFENIVINPQTPSWQKGTSKIKKSTPSSLYSQQKAHLMAIFYYMFEMGTLARLTLQKNLQILQNQIATEEPVYKNPQAYLKRIKKVIYQNFCTSLQQTIDSCQNCHNLGFTIDGKCQSIEYIEKLKKKMLNLVSEQKILISSYSAGKITQLEFFGEKKGYEVEIMEINKKSKISSIKKQRNKKGFLSPQSFAESTNGLIEPIRKNLRIDILKKTMKVRKEISHLQISQKKTEDDTLWETSKLENDVSSKINNFIALSHVDEEQSYINFKHTVRMETSKGIENVIEEQTQMYMEKDRKYPQREVQVEEVERQDNKERLLQINISAIMDHLYKIKIFAAWKKRLKKADLTKFEWENFNKNAQNILESKMLQNSLGQIDKLRNNYLQQNLSCEIMRDENRRLNDNIENLKIMAVSKKVNRYRDKLLHC